MTTTMHTLGDLEAKVERGEPFSAAELARVLGCPDLVSVGVLGEMARRRATGDVITYGRVAVLAPGAEEKMDIGDAGEVRLGGALSSIGEAAARVRAAASAYAGIYLSGFSLADVVEVCGHDHLALAEAAAELRGAGLVGIAEIPVDRFESAESILEALRAVAHAGLVAPRFTVDRAVAGGAMALINRAAEVQEQLGNGRVFAPLQRLDPVETPSTGYDDVKTIALARLRCPDTLAIQVDWPLYGPKLAQVALAYGAGDVDGVASIDLLRLGVRRSPTEEIARQIRAAGGAPVERDGRFARRG
jgi:aminodeoxyfutalosine synthase